MTIDQSHVAAPTERVWLLCLSSALFIGITAQNGFPGSVIAVPLAATLLYLFYRYSKSVWTMFKIFAAVVSITAWIAVAIEPGALNVFIVILSFMAFTIIGENGKSTNAFEIIRGALAAYFHAPRHLSTTTKTQTGHQVSRVDWRIFAFANILLPAVAVLLFGTLLAFANPLIAELIQKGGWQNLLDLIFSWIPLASFLALTSLWAIHHAKLKNKSSFLQSDIIWQGQYFKPGPVVVTLVILNLMFMLENGFDISYVWSGVALPSGMTYAEYVHRGSYTLIATAILAGGLVVLALQPGSLSERSNLIRWLVYLWTAQNVILVASSMKRTLDYVDSYGMTLWRLSGLIWMAVVAVGLILVVMRVVLKRSNLWLFNANLTAVFAVLLICGMVDFRGMVAQWNVDRALNSSQMPVGSKVDYNYLNSLGPSALPALHKLKSGIEDLDLGDIWAATKTAQVNLVQAQIYNIEAKTRHQQMDWKSWTWRGAMILRSVTP